MKRRKFIGLAGLACGGAIIGGCSRGGDTTPVSGRKSIIDPAKGRGMVFVGKNPDPAEALKAAVAAFGGFGFIAPGSSVVLKPNAAWSRTPEQAANTDPRVLSEMIRLCREAGAGKITVFEHTVDRPAAQVMAISGIAAAARDGGAELIFATSDRDFVSIDVAGGKLLNRDTLAKIVLDADVFINIPKAKHHSQTLLTLGLKNLMGVNFNRQLWHTGPDLHQYIADYATAVAVDLTVIDASRIMLTNGPKGPGRTRDPHEIIVSYDRVAADAYACTLFDLKPDAVPHVVMAGELGLGESALEKIIVERV
ncbi:MAG TPA: DUF362 domain-containing protein [Acidobacteriota bacterium]|nr:DUF362 domain-containing protein [Acidobacteriota bacterium]